MLYIASAVAAFVPMFLYLLLIWRFDRYDREPFGLLLKNYFWGAFGAIFLAIVGSSVLSAGLAFFIHGPEQLQQVETIFVAPFVEEITKSIFLLIIVTNKKFDNMTDGIVYGGAIGLGFGMTENFLYFITYGTNITHWISLVIVRTLFSAVMHCVATATFGAFLGYAKFKNPIFKITFPFIGIAIAMFIHFAWNYSVSFTSTAPIGFVFMLFTVIIFISAFTISILGEKKIIYNELLEEAENGLIPIEHLNILNSNIRNSFGWVDESIRKLYIRAATTLAFRKMQFKNSKGYNKEFYRSEIEKYRSYIFTLLTNTNL